MTCSLLWAWRIPRLTPAAPPNVPSPLKGGSSLQAIQTTYGSTVDGEYVPKTLSGVFETSYSTNTLGAALTDADILKVSEGGRAASALSCRWGVVCCHPLDCMRTALSPVADSFLSRLLFPTSS